LKYLTSIYRWIIALAVFVEIAALVLIGIYFYRPQQIQVLIRPLCRALLILIGVRVKVTGLDKFDHHKPYLIICNHESLLDAFICPGYIPMFFVVLELADHFNWPVWGYMTKKWGNIPVAKGNLQEAIKSLDKARARLENGTSILIFPEGERTVTGEMKRFRKGAFHLAMSARADILPLAMNGLYRAKTRGNWLVRSMNVNFNFGKPLLYRDYQDWDLNELRVWSEKRVKVLKQLR
jgi:1-acyl-sn-glycerol-3-phosphate acyltransferase